MPTVLITGANRGLGFEMARQFLDRDWQVIALSRTGSEALDSLSSSENLQAMRADLTDDADLERVADELRGRTIDVLINNAGTMGRKGFAAHGLKASAFGGFDRDDWHAIWDINVCTPMRLSELLVENVAASDNGRIVTLSSMLGSMEMNTVGGLYSYRASKAAVNAIMKSMGIDLAERGITTIAMHPGWVRTDMGGADADIDVETSISGMIEVIDGLGPADTGSFLSYNGSQMPY